MEENKNLEQKNKGTAGEKLVEGATILVIAGIVSKIFGALFRIPLTGLIGAEGQSYYGVTYPVYSYFLILATAGFPVAISRMVSERTALGDFKNAHKTYKVSMNLMIVIGIVSFLVCFFGAGLIAAFVKNYDAKYSIMAISPALLLAPIVASLRGYFQGQQNMIPTGVSEIIEQMVRVVIGLALSFFLIKFGAEYASAGATFGAAAGLLAALVVLIVIYRRKKQVREERIQSSTNKEESTKSLLKELVDIAIPITIGSTIMPLMLIIDAAIVMRRLQQTGWDYQMSKTLYGLISGYCDPLINLPGVFIDAIAISMIPAVTVALTLKKHDELNKNIKTGIKTMMVIAYPCTIGIIVLAKPILHLLYPTRIAEADMAVPTLQILALSIITLSTMRVFSSALQGIGKMVLPVKNLAIGAVVKIVFSYVLVGIPALNINGAATGSVAAFLVAGILNYMGLKKYANVELDLKDVFINPLLSSVIMGIAAWGVYKLVFALIGSNALATLVSIVIAVVVYFVCIFLTKTIDRDGVMLIPKGEYILKIANKMHLIKD